MWRNNETPQVEYIRDFLVSRENLNQLAKWAKFDQSPSPIRSGIGRDNVDNIHNKDDEYYRKSKRAKITQ